MYKVHKYICACISIRWCMYVCVSVHKMYI